MEKFSFIFVFFILKNLFYMEMSIKGKNLNEMKSFNQLRAFFLKKNKCTNCSLVGFPRLNIYTTLNILVMNDES